MRVETARTGDVNWDNPPLLGPLISPIRRLDRPDKANVPQAHQDAVEDILGKRDQIGERRPTGRAGALDHPPKDEASVFRKPREG
jgi:hypothetical protein